MDSKDFYTKLLSQALEHIDKEFEGKADLVSAKMGVHNPDTLQDNFNTIELIIKNLRNKGSKIFDQLPWLDVNLENAPQDYDVKFEIFWRGLITSGRIERLFVPKESRGTRGVESEISYAEEKGIEIVEKTTEEFLS